MWNFINRNYWNVVIVTAVVLALICGISAFTRGELEDTPIMTGAVNVIATPVKNLFDNVGDAVGGFFGSMANAGKLTKENAQLKNRLKVLENENEHLKQFERENIRLRDMLGFKAAQGENKVVACEVVGRSFSSWNTTFILNKGTNDGIDVGNIVMNNNGLVGNITMAGNNWAQVTTLLDKDSSVSAVITRSGAVGIVEGDINESDDNMCLLNYTSKNADINSGDTVESSGLGMVFPKGLIIGKVQDIKEIKGQVNKRITVKLSADIYNLKEVMVLI
ncbi:MAG: rod shape-determining protein MreC [Clostridia bacterium]|nr:rod shape-determining protein MreC [Clostridia bacterium]